MVGCRKDCTTFAGQTKRSVEDVIKKKSRRSTDCAVNKGIIDALWRVEMRCIGPRAKGADLWILIFGEVHRFHQEGILVEVEHVKAHRTKKEMQLMSLFEKFITVGNEKRQMSLRKKVR